MTKQSTRLRTDPELRQRIGERMRRGREEAGLSADEVSKKIGVSTTAVGQWEVGRSFPSPEHLVELLRIYAVNSDWLLGLVPDDLILNEELELVACYRQLEPKYRKGIRAGVRAMLGSDDDSGDQVVLAN